MTTHTHLGYDGSTPYEHDHDGPDGHSHAHTHDGYPGLSHDHQQTDPGDHDHGPVPDCGHLGSDVGTVRTVIRHRGRERVLCGPCGASDHWAAWDAEIDTEEAQVPEPEAEESP